MLIQVRLDFRETRRLEMSLIVTLKEEKEIVLVHVAPARALFQWESMTWVLEMEDD